MFVCGNKDGNGIGVERVGTGDVKLVLFENNEQVAERIIDKNQWQSVIMAVCGDPTNSMINEIVGKIHAAY